MAELLSVGTALPAHALSQQEAEERTRPFFAGAMSEEKRRSVFANAGVAGRRLVERPDYYLSAPPFGERNDAYLRHALPLAKEALAGALAAAGLRHEDVGDLVSVTTTGLLTPSLDARLAQELPLPRRLRRTPIFGAGCAGGAVALARACALADAAPGKAAVALSTELCSLTFLPQDGTATQLVAAALFADGAAAAVVRGGVAGGPPARARVLGCDSLLFDDSLDVMGWEFGADGMRLLLSPRAPELVESGLRGAVEPFLRRHGRTVSDVSLFVLHPGSARILDACERALDLPPCATGHSRRFLAAHGNLSSASVLFILRDVLAAARPGQLGLLAALGPGFACEQVLFETL